jgi:hypothetical protein
MLVKVCAGIGDNIWLMQKLVNAVLIRGYLDGDRISFYSTPIRYNDYGHSLRSIGIQKFLGGSDFVLLTNGDNYYCPKFVEEMLGAAEQGADFVYCDMVHSHYRIDSSSGSNYGFFATELKYTKIDVGSFIVRSSIAESVGFRNRHHDADWDYVSDILKNFPSLKIVKIPKVLFVHN